MHTSTVHPSKDLPQITITPQSHPHLRRRRCRCPTCRWSGPYLKRIVAAVKATHPTVPLTLYANGSGGLLERLKSTGVDVVGLDWTTDMADARGRLGKDISVQGNVDPTILFASQVRAAAVPGWLRSTARHARSLGSLTLVPRSLALRSCCTLKASCIIMQDRLCKLAAGVGTVWRACCACVHCCALQEAIDDAVRDCLTKAGHGRHILNLGHGVLVGTPEENVAHMFDLSKQLKYADLPLN